MDWDSSPEAWIALLTLTVLEIVLGIDNIVFISILAGKLPPNQQARARTIGLALAMITRILLLLSLTWIMRLTAPLFAILGHGFSGRDLILLVGGLFLIWKSTHEIHERLEGESEAGRTARGAVTMGGVLVQIALLDLVFSLDSVITAVGMANQVGIMIVAIMLAVGFMMFTAGLGQRFRGAASHGKDAGAQFPVAHRRDIDCGRAWPAYLERVRVLCHGVFGVCGGAKPARQEEERHGVCAPPRSRPPARMNSP